MALRRYRHLAVSLIAAAAALLAVPGPAAAAAAPRGDQAEEQLSLVHREQVYADPYSVTVGFTEWPIFSERSLDIVFRPEPGVDQVRGTLTLTSPDGDTEVQDLVRHPKMRDAYGLDIFAFPGEGDWTLRFDLTGPDGPGSGTLVVPLGPRPGPPIILGWAPVLLILGLILAAVTLGWRRYRPGAAPQTSQWRSSH